MTNSLNEPSNREKFKVAIEILSLEESINSLKNHGQSRVRDKLIEIHEKRLRKLKTKFIVLGGNPSGFTGKGYDDGDLRIGQAIHSSGSTVTSRGFIKVIEGDD